MSNTERRPSSILKVEELASASSKSKNCHHLDLGPTANEKKTSDDDELSGVTPIGQFRSMNRLPFGLNRLPCPQNN